MVMEREVRTISPGCTAYDGDTALMSLAADALEQLLPGFYGFVDEESLGAHRLEGAVPESGMIASERSPVTATLKPQ